MSFTKAELAERRNYIGASEVAAALGLSRWTTPIELWAVKTGLIEPDDGENIPAEVGNELEDYVARKYCQRTGEKVIRVSEAYTHKRLPFFRSHIDRKIVGKRKILQCKTCSAYKAREWEGEEEIPLDYIFQEFAELACSGYDEADIAVLVGSHDFQIKNIKRDDKVIAEMEAKLARFWNTFVIPKVMPTTVTSRDGDVLYRLYPKAEEGDPVALPDKANAIIESLGALNQDDSAIKAQIMQLKNELKALLGNSETGTTGIYKVAWKNIAVKEYTVPAREERRLFYKKLEQKAVKA